ncbi:primase-helicase family protein [Pararhizobium gei]|uniref:primase-helicase family protein n=1 Tax=Pararhizobium gei TaxID=1395951 RepID=UPI0023D9D92C|nr:primase-helicase family protein [Rhizobium gei]
MSKATGEIPTEVFDMMAKAEASRLALDDLAFEYACQLRGLTVNGSRRFEPGASWSADGDEFDVNTMNEEFAVVLSGGSAMIVRERFDAPVEDRLRFVRVDAFKTLFQNRYKTVRGPDGKEKEITWATAWLGHPARRQYDGLEFHPDPAGSGGTGGYLNLWQGFAFDRKKGGTYTLFKDHLLSNVCNGDNGLFRWIFGWFAQIFQEPREKPGTSLVFRGSMGVGKSKIGEIIGELLGGHYFQVDDPRYITGQFNHHMAACLLLQAEEAVWAGDKTAEGRLKGLITSKTQMIESKGIDPIRLPNYVRVIQTSNEDWVIPAGKDERRFAVFDVLPTCANNHAYFRQMDDELRNGGYETLLHDLLSFDLSGLNLRDIPKNGALLDQKIRSLDPIEAWVLERLRSGAPTKKHSGWPEYVTTEALRDDYIRSSEEVGIKRKAQEVTFGSKIMKLLPGIARKKRVVETDEGGATTRVWVYEFPSLEDCRSRFEGVLGQVYNWNE